MLSSETRGGVRPAFIVCLSAFLLSACGWLGGGGDGAANPAYERAGADVVFKPAGVRLTPPPEWKVASEGEHLILTNPNGSVRTRVYSPAERGSNAAMVQVSKAVEGPRVVTTVEPTSIADGMTAQTVTGTGTSGGRKVIWMLTEVSTPDRKPLALLTVFDEVQGIFAAGPAVQVLIHSLRKAE